ncbi:type I restriction enzyme HsdR N-terminal domain-containing protein, partial [Lactobacillus intestinalis]|uniref:type I restriction enzyme HsdR N-terminal domain-containing protein n=2 Tax=Lactobacillales TaxID=186826 RepID=UPI0025A297BF
MTELKSLSSDLLFQKQKDLKLYSEEDVKNKLLLPLLNQLGYSSEHNMRFENPIRVQVGRKKIVVRSDIEILVDNKVAIVIDVKAPDVTLSESDLLQASSYAKLVDTPPALYSFATNGHDLLGINNIDGTNVNSIPDLASLIADLQGQIRPFTDIELKEVKSTLITIMATDDLYQVIRQCKKIIENKALIRSDQSFKEMTKIMLVKMNEERRARNKGLSNRFSTQWLSISASKNSCSELDSFKELFKEAVSTYKGIYRRNDPGILINDNQSL